MTKTELFTKYKIGPGHEQWDPAVDNWFSVEVYREMHGGQLPSEAEEPGSLYVLDFLDKTSDPKYFFSLKNPGSMFLTARRMVYRYADSILEELNQ